MSNSNIGDVLFDKVYLREFLKNASEAGLDVGSVDKVDTLLKIAAFVRMQTEKVEMNKSAAEAKRATAVSEYLKDAEVVSAAAKAAAL